MPRFRMLARQPEPPAYRPGPAERTFIAVEHLASMRSDAVEALKHLDREETMKAHKLVDLSVMLLDDALDALAAS